MMKANRWAIMGLQETHESEEAALQLESFNQRVWVFANPGSRHSAGTMFIIYKDFVPARLTKADFTHKIIEAGRAHQLSFRWTNNEILRIVNVYAPNEEGEAVPFFDRLARTLTPRPSLLMGDMNHVEHAMDRIPNRGPPPARIKTALLDLKRSLSLEDYWREMNPSLHAFTWTSPALGADGTRSRSRLDRILVSSRLRTRVLGISIESSLELSDHDVVIVEVYDDTLPEIGEGRWRMNVEDLEDEVIMEETRRCLLKCQRRMIHEDPMMVWLETKAKIRNIFQNRQAMRRKERGKTLHSLKKDLKTVQGRPDFQRSKGLWRQAEALEDRIGSIQKAKLDKAAATSAARYSLQGETVSKYWFSIGKALMVDSTIRSLNDETGVERETTQEMGEIMRRHHERLQATPPLDETRRVAIDECKALAADARLGPIERENLAKDLKEREVIEAIRSSQNGKAPGKDGFIYEFYKKFLEVQEKPLDFKKPQPVITMILAKAYRARQRSPGSSREYVEGLMAAMYKKGDRREAGNYRPITLLNTDYKLETKCYATRLGKALPMSIHMDQAGFVPGRDILDHVKLAKVVAELCEVTEQDGCLVALDQEKAYDRIEHKYLWEILDAYGLPETFIEKIKSLYENAETSIMINKTTSKPFRVTRGVRQGDPMSCLLFNLAIEPLAEMLRRSPLKGIKIPGAAAKLIVKLFADDTQLYLSKKDKLEDAMVIAEKWCQASTAKFNEGKTEVLPIGTAHYRRNVVRTRSVSGNAASTDKLPNGARVVQNGEAIRILGGRVGYNLDLEEIWDPIVSKVESLALKWAGRKLTLKGRKHVVNYILLSRAQYLLMTNPPSPGVITRLERTVRRTMWNGKAKGVTTLAELYRPMEEGGLALPNFKARVTAGQMTWVKKWCAPKETRPLWAEALDALLKATAKGGEDQRMSQMLLQNWREDRSHRSKLSKELRGMIKCAFYFGVRVDAPKFTIGNKSQLPLWLARNSDLTKREENSIGAKTLRNLHGVKTHGDLGRITTTPTNGCTRHDKCLEMVQKVAIKTAKKTNIYVATPRNRETGATDCLDLTRRRRKRNEEARKTNRPICLNPDVTHREDIALATRIFATGGTSKLEPAYREQNNTRRDGLLIIWTDGSAENNGLADAKCGLGVWSENADLRASLRVAGRPQTNNRGEIAAFVKALQMAPKNQTVCIKTDSTYVLNMMDGGHIKAEDMGWLGTPNSDLLQSALYLIRTRTAETYIQKVKAHSGVEGNEKADELAKASLRKEPDASTIINVPANWKYNGARLAKMTFNSLYQWIRYLEDKGPTTRAPQIVEWLLEDFTAWGGKQHTPESLWSCIRAPPFRREVTDFYWQAFHERTVCGPFFRHWGGEWEERQFCSCGEMETLQHILNGCSDRGWVTKAWQEAVNILGESKAARQETFLIPSYEQAMTIGLISRKKKESERLIKIVISETAFTIWKLRNAVVIRNEEVNGPRAAITVRDTILRRAQVDLNVTRLPEFRLKRHLRRQAAKITATWEELFREVPGPLRWIPSDHG